MSRNDELVAVVTGGSRGIGNTFGRILSAADGRIIQFGLKLYF